jgi:hypothetical protein
MWHCSVQDICASLWQFLEVSDHVSHANSDSEIEPKPHERFLIFIKTSGGAASWQFRACTGIWVHMGPRTFFFNPIASA